MKAGYLLPLFAFSINVFANENCKHDVYSFSHKKVATKTIKAQTAQDCFDTQVKATFDEYKDQFEIKKIKATFGDDPEFEQVAIIENPAALFAESKAQVTTPTQEPKVGLDGQVGLSPWYQKNTGKPEETNLKARIQINGWINLTQDGCIKLKTRFTTGERFNNEFINTGIGTNESELKIALRQIYVSAACKEGFMKNFTFEAGAVPVKNFGNMGLSNNGTIDGVSATYNDVKHNREWMVSAGNVDAEADLFKRNVNDINHIAINVRQGFGKNLKLYTSIAHFEETFFTRVGGQFEIGEYVGWLKAVGSDSLFSDDHFIGTIGYTTFNTGKWNTRVAFSSLDAANPTESDRLALTMKQFFGYGKNLYLEVSRDISKKMSMNIRLRVGDAGPLGQAGWTYKFTLLKKK